MLTYAQARKIHFTDLASMGWTLSDPNLKVPYATSPSGMYRLWYKPQAVHVTYTVHQFKSARAVCQFGLDIRRNSVERVLAAIM